ncbi:unnamed protein product, partial [Tetraodon nigroviridis]
MEDYHKPDQQTLQALRNIANRLRINSIKATTAAGSGHPTSCCSVAEIMSVLFFHTMKYRYDDPRNFNNDRFVMSKGHAAPALYSMWVEAGFLKETELLSLCHADSTMESHSTYKHQLMDLATGSIGQGLGVACGMAYTGKYFDRSSYRVYCLMGDGEMSEGAVWEAMSFASYYQLDNLVAIMDINRLGQCDSAPLQHHVEKYQKRCEAFGWHAIVVDGHSVEELCKALSQPRHQPTAIIAKTIKGKGIPAAEDKMGWHAKTLPKDMADMVIKDLQSRVTNSSKHLYPPTPIEDSPPVSLRNIRMPSAPSYKAGEKISTRKAYGMALAKLGRYNERVVALDGDTNNLTFSEIFKNEHPNRYVSVAMGCAARDRNLVFASTLASFFTRAYDQLRIAAISDSSINLCGSHCGLSTGEEGPSLMGLEDMAMFRAIPTATVFYPSDGVSTEKAVEMAACTKVGKAGVHYNCSLFSVLSSLRSSSLQRVSATSAPAARTAPSSTTATRTSMSARLRLVRSACVCVCVCVCVFTCTGNICQVVFQSKDDQVTVVAAGQILHEALAAAEHLKKERISVRVIDPFTIKPLDIKTIMDHTRATRGRILTVEDHYHEGGLGEAVSSAMVNESGFTVHRLAVSHIPRSGKPHELLKIYGIDRDAIIQGVRKMLSSST